MVQFQPVMRFYPRLSCHREGLSNSMKVVILAGGFGTRLMEETVVKPKPMVEVGGRPIIWHIMNIYATYGFKEFIVALGYKGEVIKSYFLDQYYLENDFTINLSDGKKQVHDKASKDWIVHLIDTGIATQTSGRIKRLAKWIGNEPFMLTYGDGVANVDITQLIDYHKSRGKLATITAVRPPARFGALNFDGDNMHVNDFIEKPQMGEGWINGGFFVLEPAVLDYLGGDNEIFERAPLQNLANDNQLVAFKHDGFWQCMDTLRDVRLLEGMWEAGAAPWKVWP
jgi:glucose-1-phosphate cytidylyltransferase